MFGEHNLISIDKNDKATNSYCSGEVITISHENEELKIVPFAERDTSWSATIHSVPVYFDKLRFM